MRLYDFSIYVEGRNAILKEELAASAVINVIERIDEPGAVVDLKQKVDKWFSLYQLRKFKQDVA